MTPRLIACSLLIFSTSLAWSSQAQKNNPEPPVKASVCQLKQDPAAYEHKIVEVTGFAAQTGRENFDLFDPACPTRRDVQLEYGGKPFEEIATRFVDDARNQQFSDLLFHRGANSVVHVTILGRFFATKPVRYASGIVRDTRNTLVIERILAVDPRRSRELDYLALANQPELQREGCGYDELTEDSSAGNFLKAQEKADRGEDAWAFTDPKRVGSNGLAQLLSVDESSINLKVARRTQGRFVYEWQPKKNGDIYTVVVSRPYVLSFYAKDPTRVAWVVRAAYQAGCENDKKTRRIN